MKKILIILSTLLMTACSNTSVHLYGKYLSPEQIESASKALKQEGFSVEVNSLSFPENIHGNAFVYSPFLEDRNLLVKLENSLNTLNWTIEERMPLTSGNHWYGKKSIGLFLLPEGVKPNMQLADMIGEYVGVKCDKQATLHLLEHGKYKVTYQDDTKADLKGTWKIISYPYIEISTIDKDWPMYYEAQKSVFKDAVGLRESLELLPMKERKLFPACNFINGAK